MAATNGADPRAYVKILGKTFVDKLQQPALRIGKDTWTMYEVGHDLGIVQTKACGILSAFCKARGITSTKHLFDTTNGYSFAEYPGAGVTTLFAMFAAFRDKGLDPQAWHARGQDGAIVSFLALKHREQVAERKAKADDRKRSRKARASTHKKDVDKFLKSATS